MPWACKILAVCGGYIGFESWAEYRLFKNMK